jgi:hypothetical protein
MFLNPKAWALDNIYVVVVLVVVVVVVEDKVLTHYGIEKAG